MSSPSRQGVNEFKTEVRMLRQLRHPNLVSLIGFWYEKNEAILVYEYISNLSLYAHVHESLESDRDPLSWEQRLKICIAVARGLHYLHAGAKYAIIHQDIKSSNILLDENRNAKICDFGLSKLGPLSMSIKSLTRMDSRLRGTMGYLAPEYLRNGELSEKCDVFSFGVVLLEVLCARRSFDLSKEVDEINLVGHACKCIENGSINAIIDTSLEGRIAPESLDKFVEIAWECLQGEGSDRPSIGEVEMDLELALELHQKAQLDSHSHSR